MSRQFRASGWAINATTWLDAVHFDAQGLVPVIIQEAGTKRVLTLCYLNREALVRTLQEGKVYVYRRSQQRLMLKGETSGHIQVLRDILVDCEGKSLVFLVSQRVAACHDGYFSCYYRRLGKNGRLIIKERRLFNPRKVYRETRTVVS